MTTKKILKNVDEIIKGEIKNFVDAECFEVFSSKNGRVFLLNIHKRVLKSTLDDLNNTFVNFRLDDKEFTDWKDFDSFEEDFDGHVRLYQEVDLDRENNQWMEFANGKDACEYLTDMDEFYFVDSCDDIFEAGSKQLERDSQDLFNIICRNIKDKVKEILK